jgi:hypothetical protein
MKKHLFIATALALLGMSSNLLAETNEKGFSERGHSVLVVDHIFGLVYSRESKDDKGWLASVGSSNLTDKVAGRRLSIPRLGFHQFIGNSGISLGFGVGYLTIHDTTMMTFAPRAGYAVALSPSTALWVRLGPTFGKMSENRTDTTATALGGEFQLVVTPTPHFGVTIGPMAEVGVSGSSKRTSTEDSLVYPGSQTSITSSSVESVPTIFGLTLGILADF